MDLKEQLKHDLNPTPQSKELKRAIEIDSITAKYGFPVSLIQMYDMAYVTDDRLFIRDGASSIVIPIENVDIKEGASEWVIMALGSFTITLSKATRQLFISIL